MHDARQLTHLMPVHIVMEMLKDYAAYSKLNDVSRWLLLL